MKYDTKYYQSLEAECEREFTKSYLVESRLKNLVPIYNRIQKRKDQNTNLTLKEYQLITGRSYPCHTIRDQFGRIYVSWENAIDNVVTEYGYENAEQLYNALENILG
jgi:hypothetical protein